ncbi:tRNA (guanosine(37)-N1)-methyltransferase TrmD [Actinomadura sp. 1N219]|uniref:tRNA (guanosine(37)-N1)-methyltransferase TrmD n=1 Tax=Actinomadura sp. 1N219 TaxID=3375152 RepID=UPI0037B3D6B6
MRIDIVTIFPEYFAALDISLLGKARRTGLLDVHVHDLRGWTHDRHRTVDDTPYGGGPGMVMKPEPWGEALDAIVPPTPPPPTPPVSEPTPLPSASASRPVSGAGQAAASGTVPRLIIPTPSGRPFTQALAAQYESEPWLLFACGRYEGIDSRVVDEARTRMPVDEVSLGDFVLAGGEVAVLVMIEAIGRLLPGVLGNADSVADDSFAPGAMESLLEGPVYTKPPVWRERPVPDILLSGHHGAIARWRRDEAIRRTARHRPDLLARLAPKDLDERDRAVLREAGFPVDGEDMAD